MVIKQNLYRSRLANSFFQAAKPFVFAPFSRECKTSELRLPLFSRPIFSFTFYSRPRIAGHFTVVVHAQTVVAEDGKNDFASICCWRKRIAIELWQKFKECACEIAMMLKLRTAQHKAVVTKFFGGSSVLRDQFSLFYFRLPRVVLKYTFTQVNFLNFR